jgi:hypothetical protein
MSDYAFVVTCNPGYEFGLRATIGAQKYFGTDADWEVAYDYFTDEQRGKYPSNVHWTPIEELTSQVVDNRTDKSCQLERYWIGYWLLAHRLLKEKKYKAICVTQADQFTFTNLDNFFKIAEGRKMVSTYYPFTNIGVNLPYGDDKAIWNRCQCGLFDSLNFISERHVDLVADIVNMQAEDAFRDESNHSVIALNRSVCRHLKYGDVVGLHGDSWVCDNLWGRGSFELMGDAVFLGPVQMFGWHQRWWQVGRQESELFSNPATAEAQRNNYKLIFDYMKRMEKYV